MRKTMKARALAILILLPCAAMAQGGGNASPRPGIVVDPELYCLLQLRAAHEDIFNPRTHDPEADAAEAVAARDFRPVGYVHGKPGALEIEASGIDCPSGFTDFRRKLGFGAEGACTALYNAAAKPYVTAYNKALVEAVKKQQIDICVTPK